MLTAVSSATSSGPAAASASTVPAAARAKNACSSIAPAYRDLTVSGRASPSLAPEPSPPPEPPAPAGSAASASGSAGPGRGSSGSGPAACTGPRRRSTVDWFTPSRRAISASRTPSARHARAFSHDAPAVSRGRPSGRISPAVPSRSDRWYSVDT